MVAQQAAPKPAAFNPAFGQPNQAEAKPLVIAQQAAPPKPMVSSTPAPAVIAHAASRSHTVVVGRIPPRRTMPVNEVASYGQGYQQGQYLPASSGGSSAQTNVHATLLPKHR